MSRLTRFAGLFLGLALLSNTAFASDDPAELPDGKDIKGAVDHPQIQRFEGSSIRYYEKKAFDEMQVALGPVLDDKPKIAKVEGVHTTIVYEMPKDVSTLEAVRAYQAEVAKVGDAKLLFSGMNGGGRQELDRGVNEFMTRVYGDVYGPSRWMNWNSEYRYAIFRASSTCRSTPDSMSRLPAPTTTTSRPAGSACASTSSSRSRWRTAW
jgi:hypothetical protein